MVNCSIPQLRGLHFELNIIMQHRCVSRVVDDPSNPFLFTKKKNYIYNLSSWTSNMITYQGYSRNYANYTSF